ncbi:hypothetical protein CsSME_00036672 [Camellia sinensis var. sinensis]
MLNDWCEIHIRIEDFGNAMTEQHEKGVRYSEEGVSHTVAGALHARDGLTQSPERVPAFTETVIHSEERSHADEQHLQTTHASHEEVLVSAITHSEKRSTQSEDGIQLFTERVTHCGEGGSHVNERGDHMLMNEYYLVCLWTLFLIEGSETDIKLLWRASHRLQNPHVARELAKLDILGMAPEEIKEANGLIGDTIYAGKNMKLVLSIVSYLVRVLLIWDNGICINPIMVYNLGRGKIVTLAQLHGKVEVAKEYKLVSDTLYLTVSYIDRFLSHHALSRNKFQLLGTLYKMGTPTIIYFTR